MEFRLKRADGVYRWHSGLAAAGCDADKNIIKWFGTNPDIDDKKSAEKTWRESEQKSRSKYVDDAVEGLRLPVERAAAGG